MRALSPMKWSSQWQHIVEHRRRLKAAVTRKSGPVIVSDDMLMDRVSDLMLPAIWSAREVSTCVVCASER